MTCFECIFVWNWQRWLQSLSKIEPKSRGLWIRKAISRITGNEAFHELVELWKETVNFIVPDFRSVCLLILDKLRLVKNSINIFWASDIEDQYILHFDSLRKVHQVLLCVNHPFNEFRFICRSIDHWVLSLLGLLIVLSLGWNHLIVLLSEIRINYKIKDSFKPNLIWTNGSKDSDLETRVDT